MVYFIQYFVIYYAEIVILEKNLIKTVFEPKTIETAKGLTKLSPPAPQEISGAAPDWSHNTNEESLPSFPLSQPCNPSSGCQKASLPSNPSPAGYCPNNEIHGPGMSSLPGCQTR